MTNKKLNELYSNQNLNSSSSEYFVLIDTENPDKLRREFFLDYHKKNVLTPYKFYPAMAVFTNYGNGDVLIIFGVASIEMGFSPAPIKIGNLCLSYYKYHCSSYDHFTVETDLKIDDKIDFDISTIANLNFRIHQGHLSPGTRLINLLRVLNWCYPHFDAIDKEKLVSSISNDYSFYKDKLQVYLKAIQNLDWEYEWKTRYKSGEGTLDDFYYKIILTDNEYVNHLIKSVVRIEECDSDVGRYNQKEIDEKKYMHINKARLLAFENFMVSKYFLSLVRDYEKYPFKSIPIDIQ